MKKRQPNIAAAQIQQHFRANPGSTITVNPFWIDETGQYHFRPNRQQRRRKEARPPAMGKGFRPPFLQMIEGKKVYHFHESQKIN